MEKDGEEVEIKRVFIMTFIDRSKPLDSLVWEALWKITECLGCPTKFVAVVRSLYSQSTISIRLSIDGDSASSFVQKKGHQARFWSIILHLHDTSRFYHESGRIGMQGIGNDGIRG